MRRASPNLTAPWPGIAPSWRCLRAIGLQILGKGLPPDLLALGDAGHGRSAEVNPGIDPRGAVLFLGLAEVLKGTSDARERWPARHGEAHLVRAEEASHHRGGRASAHAMGRGIVGQG